GRVRSLPHDLAQVVASVSVLGSPTDVVVVSNMLGLPVGEIDARADELEKRGLLRRDGASALSLPSPLLSEVVFGDLEPDELAEVHRQAAHAYQRAIADGVESDGSRAAYHLVEAGEHQAAAEAYAASGLSHLKAGRFERAVGELSQALSLVNLHTHELEPMAEWIAGLSRGIRHAPASREIALLLRRIAQHYSVRPRLDDLHASLLVVLASSLAELEDYPQATELLERVAGDASLNSSSVRAALITLAQVSIQRGEFGVAVSALSRAESLGEGDYIEQHHRLLTQAHALAGTGQRDSADAAWQRAEGLTAELDVAARAESIRTRARILGLYGDWTGSADVSAEAAEVARAAGLGHEFALNLNQQGVALLRANQLPRAYAVLKNALGVAEELGSERLITKTQLLLADLDRLRGADQPR
ncbi:MAG TPA: hypothetical protein VGJ84_11490, partial [Polyangiaceae bacterium]